MSYSTMFLIAPIGHLSSDRTTRIFRDRALNAIPTDIRAQAREVWRQDIVLRQTEKG